MIDCLQYLINKRKDEVNAWIQEKRQLLPKPVYASFDIRDNGTKASIVDSNLFPAGFNNLSSQSRSLAAAYFRSHLTNISSTDDILIIPEAHTRNLYYLSNLNALRGILQEAGYTVTLGTIREDVDETLEIEDSDGKPLILEKMRNEDCYLKTKSFQNGLILLNNDFSVRMPDLLKGVCNTIIPPLQLGWHHRRKYNHFKHFCDLVDEFAQKVSIDCWLLCPATKEVSDIDFKSGQNLDKVADEVDRIIGKTAEKYKEYKLDQEPFVFVKDNSGTYGMGIVTVKSGKELLELNSKERRGMRTGKERAPITSVVIQEGIATKYKVNGSAAEPVLYSVGGRNVGGFMRVHADKDDQASLNAPGAKFDVLLRDNITRPIVDFMDEKKELSLYSLLSNIANLAIGKEMEEVE